jgi:hypothetical protein
VTGESQSDRDTSASKPSLPLFDPVAGMRAVADIQAEGLRAAGALLERMLGAEPEENGHRPASLTGEYAALVDAWTDVIRRFVAGMAQPGRPDAVTVAVDASGVGPSVRLALDESTGEAGAVAEIWLHNGTSSTVGPLVLRCGELRNSDGKRLKGAKVRFDPPAVESLPARSSRTVAVSLVSKEELRPGVYRGTIQARGAPGLWLPVEVVIEPC